MQTIIRLTLRLPQEVYRGLVALARQEERSLNNVIVMALRAYLEGKKGPNERL